MVPKLLKLIEDALKEAEKERDYAKRNHPPGSSMIHEVSLAVVHLQAAQIHALALLSRRRV